MNRVASLGLAMSLFLSVSALAGVVDLGPIETDDAGNPYMSQLDAQKLCAQRGGRLPTIGELASTLLPKAVSDVPMPGFSEIQVKGQETFYFKYMAYPRPPAGEQRNERLWSSSCHQTLMLPDGDFLPTSCMILDGRFTLNELLSDMPLARVRCVR